MNDPSVRAVEDGNADDLILRASDRMPSPISGPEATPRTIEIVREETAARTQLLEGTPLDARMSRLPRAGTYRYTYT